MSVGDLIREAVEAGLTGRPTCWMCGGVGHITTGGHCTHGTRRRGEEPCTEACVKSETCLACFGTGVKEGIDGE